MVCLTRGSTRSAEQVQPLHEGGPGGAGQGDGHHGVVAVVPRAPRRVRVAVRDEPTPLVVASNADAFHSSDCARGPRIEECEFSRQMDDYVNIHTTARAERVTVTRVRVRLRVSLSGRVFLV